MIQLKLLLVLLVTITTTFEVADGKTSNTFLNLIKFLGDKRFKYHNGHFYFFSTRSKSWGGADFFCRHIGGNLASIHSDAENNFIAVEMKARNVRRHMYFGLTDQLNEGTFSWSDKSQSKYRNWEPNEPNGGTRENCGVIYSTNFKTTNGKWNDADCCNKIRFVCKF